MSKEKDKPSSQPEHEHLGWRATSSMPSKKRKFIEGVSGRGVVELQAQLYRTQEQARLQAEGGVDVRDKHLRRKAGIDVSSIKNRGVEEREARDKALTLKTTGGGAERLAESSAALERKAALYDKLSRQGGGADSDEDNRYEVEFWRKGPSHQEEEHHWHQQQQQTHHHEQDWLGGEGGGADGGGDSRQAGLMDSAAAAVGGSGDMMTQDMARERDCRAWEASESARLQAEAECEARRAAHREAVRELTGLTQAGRREAAAAKAAKEEQLAAKRARLKAAFVNQRVQAIMASKQQQQQQRSSGSSKAGSSSKVGSSSKAGNAAAKDASKPG